MNACPVISIRPLSRPAFDDTNLGNEGLWILDNAAALARYWQRLGRALGIDDKEGEEDIDVFCRQQHAQQMDQHPMFVLPHGEGSL